MRRMRYFIDSSLPTNCIWTCASCVCATSKYIFVLRLIESLENYSISASSVPTIVYSICIQVNRWHSLESTVYTATKIVFIVQTHAVRIATKTDFTYGTLHEYNLMPIKIKIIIISFNCTHIRLHSTPQHARLAVCLFVYLFSLTLLKSTGWNGKFSRCRVDLIEKVHTHSNFPFSKSQSFSWLLMCRSDSSQKF